MNNNRRKELKKAIDLLSEARFIIEQIAEEERDAFDNLPEGLQIVPRFEAMEDFANRLDDVAYSIEEAESEVEDVISS